MRRETLTETLRHPRKHFELLTCGRRGNVGNVVFVSGSVLRRGDTPYQSPINMELWNLNYENILTAILPVNGELHKTLI